MKVAEFALSCVGLLATLAAAQMIPLLIFGALGLISFRQAMKEFQEGGEEEWEE